MKKGLKFLAAAAVAASAVAPVAATPASAATPAGVYTSEGYFTIAQFNAKTTAEKGRLLSLKGTAIVLANSNAISGATVISGTNAQVTSGLKPLAEYQTTNKVTLDNANGVTGEGITNTAGSVAVSSVSAINPTTIKVTFSQNPTAAQTATTNFTLSKGTVEGVTVTGKEAVLSVKGLAYGESTTVTVGNPANTTTVKVPAINELYSLVITTDATNNTIKSDGASTTMLTAKLVEKATGNVVVNDAQIQYSTTLGSLSQPQVALVNGAASTQLRSVSSAVSQTAVVNATVASAPGATQYVGLTGTLVVNFTPAGVTATDLVSAVSAGADQGDRFFVKFSGNVSAADYKSVVNATGWAGKPYGIQYKGAAGAYKDLKIVDVYNVTNDTLMFVLDTDVADSINPGKGAGAGNIEMIDSNFAATGTGGNFLRDNVNHTIKFPDVITGKVASSADITFMASDVTKPFIYGVDAKDEKGNDSTLALTIRASESLAQTLTEGADNAVNSNFSIDGKAVKLMTGVVTVADVLNAKNNNQVIVTSLKVGEYDTTKTPAVDNRSKVYITLHKDFVLSAGSHGIQIANIGDLAGETDSPANKVTTQTFPFTVVADTAVPTATVTAQSPEQWLITFNKPVDTITGKNIADALKIYTKEGYAATTKVPLVQGANSGAGDYKVSIIDENGVAKTADLATNATFTNVERLLVEFNQDWSLKLKGNTEAKDNYWKSEINPFKVVLNNIESSTGVKYTETAYDVAPQYDGTSATITAAQDLFEKAPNTTFRGIDKSVNNAAGKYVYVEMSEPVQLLEDVSGIITAKSNPVTPNLTQDPTQATTAYNNKTGLPVATYRFVKGDKTVYGNATAVAEDDKSFVIQPKSTLEAGTWTLYIEQISDDHGNTTATVSKQVVVPQTTVQSSTKVAWAAFDNNAVASNYDYLYVKFTEEMKANTANGVDLTTNYKFRGYDLPEGSQVFQGIGNVTDKWDGVTIRMPKDAWKGLGDGEVDFTTNMSVASNFESKAGQRIGGDVQFELTDLGTTTTYQDKDGVIPSAVGGAGNKFEAVYINSTATLVAGTPVIFVTATDAQDNSKAANKDGKFDTFTVQLSENNKKAIAVTDKYYINGKEYNPTAAQAANNSTILILKPATGTDQVAGTDIRTATLKTSDNSIIATTVKNEAVAVSAVLNAAKTELTVTFSEAVTKSSTASTFTAVTAATNTTHGDKAPLVGTDATFAVKEHSASTPNVIVYTVANGANIGKDDTFVVAGTDMYTLRTGTTAVATEVPITNSDATLPTVSSVTATSVNAGNDTIAIKFSELMDTSAVALAGIKDKTDLEIGYADDATGTNYTAFTVSNLTSASWVTDTLTITLDEATDKAIIPDGKFVIVKEGSANTTVDLAGNKIATGIIGKTSAAVAKETTKPVIAATTTLGNKADTGIAGTIENDDTIVLNFAEQMDATTMGTAYNVVVAANGTMTIYKGNTDTTNVVAVITGVDYNGHVTDLITFNSSVGAWSSSDKTLTITLKSLAGGTAASSVAAGQISVTLGAAAVDLAGNAGDAATATNGAADARF